MPTKPAKELLIRLTAELEALFEPHRYPTGDTSLAAEIFHRRAEYRTGGLPIVGGGSMAARKSHSRLLAELRKDGLVTTTAGTRPGVLLTERGAWFAWSLSPHEPFAECLELLRRIERLTDSGHHNDGHVLEVYLLDKPNYQNVAKLDLIGIQCRLAIFLQLGWLTSSADIQHRVGYSLTPTGRKALEDGFTPPAGLPKYNPADYQIYVDSFEAACRERGSWKPQRAGNLAIPLGAGSWGLPPEFTEATS